MPDETLRWKEVFLRAVRSYKICLLSDLSREPDFRIAFEEYLNLLNDAERKWVLENKPK